MYIAVQAASEIAGLMADARQGLADIGIFELPVQDAVQFLQGCRRLSMSSCD